MKQSEKLKKDYDKLRIRIHSEICVLIKKHKDIEMEQEFEKPPFYSIGYDEQDENQVIERVDLEKAYIMHQGNSMGDELLEHLPTHTLVEILEELEKSYEASKKFLEQ